MLKGKSTIQLFDAATGEKLLEQSDTNMVTNALDIIANVKDKTGLLKWWRETNSSNTQRRNVVTPFFNLLPLYSHALSGVLLWDDNIEEDPSVVSAPSAVSEVGHAGADYSGTDIYRGSYNENESGEISGGYRHVWDFDTDKANGTIKCLSLTSRHGGNIGYHGCFSGDLFPRFNHCYFHNENTFFSAQSNISGIKLETTVEGTGIYLRSMEDGTLRLYKRSNTQVWYLKLPDPSKIGLSGEMPVFTEKVMLPISLTNTNATVYVYKGQIHEVALLTTSQLQHRIFSLEGEQVSSKTLDLPFTFRSTSYIYPAVYRDGYYYCIPHNDCDIVKVDEQGKEVGRITFLSHYNDAMRSVTISDYNGEITFAVSPNGAITNTAFNAYTLNAKDVIGAASYNLSYPCVTHSSSTAPPFSQYLKTDDPSGLFVLFYDPFNLQFIPLTNSLYLATINNLQTPITKTSAQTMKITYEIYDE